MRCCLMFGVVLFLVLVFLKKVSAVALKSEYGGGGLHEAFTRGKLSAYSYSTARSSCCYR